MKTLEHLIHFQKVEVSEIARHLARFYVEARPKTKPKTVAEPMEYHRNSMINIRAAINRYIHNQNRSPSIDIVKDKDFKTANGVLDGLFKEQMRSGTARPTVHKQIIEREDLDKIAAYFKGSLLSPIILRHCVWFQLCLHFVSRGLEFHHQLRLDSFIFHEDDCGQYVTLRHETKMKNDQGGIESMVSDSKATEKRMYTTGSDICPVKLLKHLIEKSDPSSTHLFNQYLRQSVVKPEIKTWYSPKSLSKRTFAGFLNDICNAAGLKTRYTAHCLRATAIPRLSRA